MGAIFGKPKKNTPTPVVQKQVNYDSSREMIRSNHVWPNYGDYTRSNMDVDTVTRYLESMDLDRMIDRSAARFPALHGASIGVPRAASIVAPIAVIKPKIQEDDDKDLEMAILRSYPVPAGVRSCERDNIQWKTIEKNPAYSKFFEKKSRRSDQNAYISAFRFMIYLDEESQKKHLERFDARNIKLTPIGGMKFSFPVTDKLYEVRSSHKDLDQFTLTPEITSEMRDEEIRGELLYIDSRRVIVEFNQWNMKSVNRLFRRDTFSIKFQVNPTNYQLQHTALDYIESHKLFDIIINNPLYESKQFYNPPPKPNVPAIKLEGTLFNGLNKEQQNTVRNILRKADSLPFILFGPPGTGKTRTIVAAIEQIVRTTNENVLVCTMSNSANDEIAERLANVLEPNEVYRMYARKHKESSTMTPTVKSISNWNPNKIRLKSLKKLYKYRVMCTTLSMAGCFSRAHINKGVWRPDHFGYIFIDECASSSETMTLIPIAGVCTSPDKIHAKIVLAGDPKQLDAVTKSKLAARVGYKTSLLETLITKGLYKSKGNALPNQNYMSMLVKNYRSHPSILRIPNERFYQGRLEPLASKDIIDWYIGSSILPAKNFPIIFKSVQGKCEQTGGTSSFNDDEVNEVVAYVEKLLPPRSQELGLRKIQDTDIGVVTPYAKQSSKLRSTFEKRGYKGITVGTAEVFQGKEKPVMIVSTVRSGGSLGFVRDERRFNVVITRAKCLLIIIGDPHTLGTDANWRKFLKHCLFNSGFIQSDKIFQL